MIIFKIWTVCSQSPKVQMTKALAAMLDVPTEEATSVGHLFANIIHHGCDDVTRKNRKIHIQDFLKNFRFNFLDRLLKE